MKHLLFELIFPSIGSWNGKFTGANKKYYRTKSYTKDQESIYKKMLSKRKYTHNFCDGWVAQITIREIQSKEKKTYEKASAGFLGYEWMIADIEKYGRIRSQAEIAQHRRLKNITNKDNKNADKKI